MADAEALGPSLGLMGIFVVVSVILAKILVGNRSKAVQGIFIWYTYDALVHLIVEGSFVWMSLTGTVATNKSNLLAPLWQEYGKADSRWLHSDPDIVSVELLTVIFDGLLCLYLLYLLKKDDFSFHYWNIILCTCELYGGWMTFAPEWLTGSPSLDTSNPLYLWVYLVISNGIWVVIPIILLGYSFVFLKQNPLEGKAKRS